MRGSDAKCRCQMDAGTDLEAAGIKIGEELLVHVHVEAVEGSKMVRYVFVFVKNENCPGIHCVFRPRSLWLGGRFSDFLQSGRHPWGRFL